MYLIFRLQALYWQLLLLTSLEGNHYQLFLALSCVFQLLLWVHFSMLMKIRDVFIAMTFLDLVFHWSIVSDNCTNVLSMIFIKRVFNFSDITEYLVDEVCQTNSSIDPEFVSSISWLPLVCYFMYIHIIVIKCIIITFFKSVLQFTWQLCHLDLDHYHGL